MRAMVGLAFKPKRERRDVEAVFIVSTRPSPVTFGDEHVEGAEPKDFAQSVGEEGELETFFLGKLERARSAGASGLFQESGHRRLSWPSVLQRPHLMTRRVRLEEE